MNCFKLQEMKRKTVAQLIHWVLGLSLAMQLCQAGTVNTIQVHSDAMDTTLPNIIVLPDTYYAGDENYPVLYLLHGWSGSYQDWSNKSDLSAIADKYQLIIVCPEGGYAGWYLDSPVNPKNQFTAFIGRELVHWVDRNYRTKPDRRSRAITGLSMGGHGALYIAGIYSETFAGAGAMSGVLNLTQTRFAAHIRDLMGLQEIADLIPSSVYGNSDRLAALAPVILLDCGVDDAFITSNREMHQLLLKRGIDHSYIERPGGHSWTYWTNALEYHILFFRKELGW